MSIKWEYASHSGDPTNLLEMHKWHQRFNEYGQDGWELVSVTSVSTPLYDKEIGKTTCITGFFKRPIDTR